VDLSLIGEEVSRGLAGLRTGTVRPELLPEDGALADAMASENTGVQENSPGSNNWAISGRLTASGKVIVANDPHRNVSNPSIRYIVHLNAPGWDMIGATEAPFPGVAIGHNGRVAWGLTIVGTDQSDVYVETVNPENPNQVRFRGRWEDLRIVRDTIRVKGAALVVEIVLRHGPVFHEDAQHHSRTRCARPCTNPEAAVTSARSACRLWMTAPSSWKRSTTTRRHREHGLR
jgi:penicillin amidase